MATADERLAAARATVVYRAALRLALASVLRRRGTGSDEDAAHNRATRDALNLLLSDAETPLALSMETDGAHIWLEDSAGQRIVIE
jgi:hypothetical protein